MTKLRFTALAAATALALAAAFTAAAQAPAKEDRVARGKYIVSTSGCHDCHTPWVMGPKGPEPDMTRALSGHPRTWCCRRRRSRRCLG